jgi:maltodextrin utilization protein YvdJ
MYIELLFHYQGHLSDLEDRIVALANELEEYKRSSNRFRVSEKKSQPRLSQKLVKSIGLIIRKNWLPSLE